jgi:hypothetical protein
MKTRILALVLCLAAGAAQADTKNLRPWDRETVGVTPVGSDRPNRPRTDTTDYGVKFSSGAPALGCSRQIRDVTTPDGRSGPAATFDCRW